MMPSVGDQPLVIEWGTVRDRSPARDKAPDGLLIMVGKRGSCTTDGHETAQISCEAERKCTRVRFAFGSNAEAAVLALRRPSLWRLSDTITGA